MTEEYYISIETAKLAKKKGFNEKTHYGWSNRYFLLSVEDVYNWNDDKSNYSVPSQANLARWLREKHKLSVEAFYSYGGLFSLCISNMRYDDARMDKWEDMGSYHTYEEAMEAGLQKALELINEKEVKDGKM
jgi:hypothetical protein